MLTIGEFSRICFVTKKTLRHYDEIGLLRPEFTAENGYRYYSAEQLHTMLLISRLKNYGLSLPEITAVLANPNADRLAEKLLEKRRQMEAGLVHTRRLLSQLDEDVAKLKRRMDIMDQNIVVKTVERTPLKVFGIRKKMDVKYFSESFAHIFQQVGQRKLHPVGPPMAFYHDEEGFDAGHSDIEVAVPVSDDGEDIRVLDGGLHCFATLVGPYVPEAFTATYAGLYQWVQDNGYHICGAPFDIYVRGGEGVAPADYVTEIYFPIVK